MPYILATKICKKKPIPCYGLFSVLILRLHKATSEGTKYSKLQKDFII